ncbi:hypothetical protein J3F83DRAFT_550907 [Trichoderma novae-zelandiae]
MYSCRTRRAGGNRFGMSTSFLFVLFLFVPASAAEAKDQRGEGGGVCQLPGSRSVWVSSSLLLPGKVPARRDRRVDVLVADQKDRSEKLEPSR